MTTVTDGRDGLKKIELGFSDDDGVVKVKMTDGIVGSGRIMGRGRAAVVVTVVSTTRGMRPSVVTTPGRGPVVTSGAGRLRGSNMVMTSALVWAGADGSVEDGLRA